jgi:heat shock protein HtpX
MRTLRVPVLLASIGAAVAVVVALVLLLVLPVVVALVVGVVVGAVVALQFFLRAEASVIGSTRPRLVDEDDEPRLHNMLDGLCDSHGFHRPALAIIDDDARNAVVYGRSASRVTLAVTRGVRDSLSSMELEGLLARELALATHDGLPAATVMVPILAVLPGGLRTRVSAWFSGPQQPMIDDFDAVRFTRYPPGLASALDTMAAASTVVAGVGRTSGHLWVVPPDTSGSPMLDLPTIDARAAALREL